MLENVQARENLETDTRVRLMLGNIGFDHSLTCPGFLEAAKNKSQ